MSMYIDDEITKRVEDFGGRTKDVVLRCSIEWNDGVLLNNDDLDLWCIEPSGEKIHYAQKESTTTCGFLDVDITGPSSYYKSAVENIIYTSKKYMNVGKYIFAVHQFAFRGSKSGFNALIVMDGEEYHFYYDDIINQGEVIEIAEVTLRRDNSFEIRELMRRNFKYKDRGRR